ncbi:MAG: tetratricopeptide repeat protein [Magnetococcales bacterium]|nr:tetratricopeptide repeat protein [Magnetococcales bacterium]
MMHEHIKKRIIKELIGEIVCLGAIELELVGHYMVSVLEGGRMVHHGINKDYKPVGYTVDSFSDDSTVVAEYSTEQGYFENEDSSPTKNAHSFPKIENDIQHALGHRQPQGPDKIYLITNHEEPPSFRAKFNTTFIGQSHGGRVVFLDAREMAKKVYQQSTNNQDCAAFYRQFFPGFSQNLDNYEYYGKLPAPCDGHIHDQGIGDALAKHFEAYPVCVLHGVSGSGKTQAAIGFVHHQQANEFENYVWITGEDWPKDTSLSAVQRSRGGAPVNIVGLFNASKAILVIDGLERPVDRSVFDELQNGFQKGGVVLVTSQSAIMAGEGCLPIPEVSIDTASRILGEDYDNASGEAKRFIQSCKFNPLILSTARAFIVQDGVSSNDLYKEVLDSPSEISSRDGQSIMGKILKRLENGAFQALKKIANSGLTTHDLEFLRKFIGISHSRTLQHLSILLPTSTPGVARIHDLVCMAVRDQTDGKELATAVEQYVGDQKGEMTPSALREIHLALDPLQAEHARRGERDPDWLSYALLQVESDAKQALHEQIHSKEISPGVPIPKVMCLIDAKEAHAYAIDSPDERKEYYRQCAEQFGNALAGAADEDVRAELLHHRGKALRRCENHQEALNCFTQLLSMKPEWHATHGQIAHLGMQYGVSSDIKDAGERSMRALIDGMTKDASAVPLRVSLAALARLRSYGNVVNDLSKDPAQVQKLADLIALSAMEGFGQFYEAFVSFTSKFGYHHPSICLTLAERLPEMLAMPPETVEKGQWVSACEALANTATSARKEDRRSLVDQLLNASVQFATAISAGEQLKSYDARAAAKAFIIADMPQKALETIAKVPADRIDHWILYRKAEAELALEKCDEALATAQQAVELVGKDHRATEHISSYHKLLSEVYERRGQIDDAHQEAKKALDKCKDDQFQNTLAERVARLEGMLP